MIVPSVAYKRFEGSAVAQLMEQNHRITTITKPCHLELEFHIKGKIHVDLDNLISSICDILELTGVVEDDDLITSINARETQGNKNWVTELVVYEKGGEDNVK